MDSISSIITHIWESNPRWYENTFILLTQWRGCWWSWPVFYILSWVKSLGLVFDPKKLMEFFVSVFLSDFTSNLDLEDWLGYFWPWIFKVKLYLGNGRPDCHGMKGTGVNRMPWCKRPRKLVNWTLHWLGYLYLDLWPWIFKVKLYLGTGRPDCHGTIGARIDRMPWCETLYKWVNRTLCWLGYFWPTFTFDLEFSKSNCISGMGGPIVMEQKGGESMGCPDVKHRHYVTSKQRILGWLMMSAFPSTRLP